MLALQLREQLGCVGVVVDAKPQAVAFYSPYGFEPLEAVSGHLHDRPEPLADAPADPGDRQGNPMTKKDQKALKRAKSSKKGTKKGTDLFFL